MPAILYPSVFNAPGKFTTTNNAPRGGECLAPPTTRGRDRQQPPGLTWVPGVFTTGVPQGWATSYPATTRHLNPRQPQGEVSVPGAFTTTNTTQGGVAVYPDTTRHLNPQQPPGQVWVAGAFTTTNSIPQGGEVFAPSITRHLAPQQPPGFVSVLFQPAALPNTQFGGESFFPDRTRHLNPQQPQGEVLPPGVFVGVTPSTTAFGWTVHAPNTTRAKSVDHRQYPSGDGSGWLRPPPTPPGPRVVSGRIVPRVPIRLQTTGGQTGQAGQGGGGGQTRYDAGGGEKFPQKIDPRSVRFTEIVETILNSLIGNGSIYKTGAGEWAIAFIPREVAWADAFFGELFWDLSTGTLSYKESDGTVHHYP